MSLEDKSSTAYNPLSGDDSVLTFRKSELGGGRMGQGNRTHVILIGVIGLCLGIGVGVLIGWFSSEAQFPDEDAYNTWRAALTQANVDEISDLLIKELNANNIKENLR